MSKILLPGEIGYGILIEEDAGYIDADLNKRIINEGVINLDNIKLGQPILINCILQKWGVENKNGRIYPKEVLIPQVDQYRKLVETNSAVSQADHPDCVLPDSEILTKNGWKVISDISEDEEIQTLNTTTNEIEIEKIEKKIYKNYNGEMFEFKSLNLDLTVTPNHRFLLEDQKGTKFYMTAKEIYENVGNIFSSKKYKILKKGNWKGKHQEFFTLKGISSDKHGFNKKNLYKNYYDDIQIKSKDWFAFLGIYLADGHATGTISKIYKSKGFNIVITQKKEKTKKEIENLLKKLPFSYWKVEYKDGKTQYNINDGRLYEYLYKLGSSEKKYIPFEIKNASKELLEIFFKWFSIGDGRSVKTKYKSNKTSVFSTSKQLIDDLHEILLKIGRSGNISTYQPKNRKIIDKKEVVLENGEIIIEESERVIPSKNSKLQYNLNISSTNYICLDNRSIKINKINYDGKIACVRVPNSNFMVRRNGKSHWTGNSSIVSLHDISHLITKMWWGQGDKENILYGQLKLIISPGFIKQGICSMIGDKILVYLSYGIRLGISSRGVGSLQESNGKNIVQNDFELICFDLVASPSTPGAYLFPDKNEIQMSEDLFKNKNLVLENDKKIINALNKFLL